MALDYNATAHSLDIRVSDTGIGVPSNELNYIFERYYQSSKTAKLKDGTGIGLYIVKKLCDKLGHKIIIESEIHKYTKITIIFYKNDFYKVD